MSPRVLHQSSSGYTSDWLQHHSSSTGATSPRLQHQSRTNNSEHDLLDLQVRHILRTNVQESKGHSVHRLAAGRYEINGHHCEIQWQPALEAGELAQIVVVNGPLRQPLIDYLAMNESTADYDTHTIARTSSLHQVPREKRMTFDDTHKSYTRLEAMKIAKEQASIREKAADYTREGRQVPDDLMKKYNKTLYRRQRGEKNDDSPCKQEEKLETMPCKPKQEPTLACKPIVSETICSPIIAPRGVSLNGIPSFMPSKCAVPSISRSWSRTNMQGTAVPQSLLTVSLAQVVVATCGASAPAAVAVTCCPGIGVQHQSLTSVTASPVAVATAVTAVGGRRD